MLKRRITYLGEDSLGRINKGKLWSFESALNNSYQTAIINVLPDIETEYKCLINPDTLRPDYDNKVISIGNTAGVQPGSTFYWPTTNTYWLVYLDELTETAYFRGYIRRCKYTISINDNIYYLYVRGPTETDVRWNQKAGVEWNDLNLTTRIYMTKNSETLNFFHRFDVIQLNGKNWQVQAIDDISMEGILEVDLEEYYTNSNADYQIFPTPSPIPPAGAPRIMGESLVHPYEQYEYYVADFGEEGSWSISDASKATIISEVNSTIIVEIIAARSSSFNLIYTQENYEDIVLPITILSLF